ncbi:putative Hydrolase or acyltransferase (Alpha/beta hydrolase superfamily) [Alloalcanivorax dieselolei B5]|uniref:Putative Hydrolase or acyltransferase (Alpha/beta hydrolase superfamily) n=1 Tax=Alcanivorax dieselolei (strain DSM 16502 / CGMCC 1.3690 / MCCC 1A00001 / B-5) TaxID=930169 RepID=K0C6B2_ALCDB|nr:alpha/beta hydrolase [Alloalcanivorax dieselolei]AFT69014.1 putative Hydrolase or acyltransferase (Alpha/beta hydrolase superfamily) [Alloalcanivorax dieselolei B5]GGJ81878.1 alpha/beta hydrolase [Alloalcanivorax dieselolei]
MLKQDSRQALIDRIGIAITQASVMAGPVNTAYLSAGAGVPVICLHGGGAGAVTWYPSIGPLAQRFHVVAPDIVGYGESDKPDGSYDKAYFSGWLKQFLDALGIAKAHIVGLSQGGAIALQFTLDYPEMVDKLVLVDSGGLGAKPPLMSIASMLWLNIFPSSWANRFYSRYILFKPGNRDPNHERYSVEVLKTAGGKKAFSQGRGAAVAAFTEEALRRIRNRTLIVWGENDRLFPIESAAKAATIISNAELLGIRDAGHLPMMDQPAMFNRAVVNFLLNKMDV